MKLRIENYKGKDFKVTPYDDDCAFKADEVVRVQDVVTWGEGYQPLLLCVGKDGSMSYCLPIELEEL